ncbi:BAR-domain-containing protein [Trametes gibbosa]|nr:BAR-domain-containing protein [Trametes gibbosa]
MASKQLGKLRQLVGEVIATRDKTIQSDEFRELEHDIELRRQGLWKLDLASDDYRHYLLKKKLSEALENADKLLAVDALGAVMIKHGEEFGEDSAYGQSLVSFGRAHCNIAALQESYALTFEESYLTTVRQSEDDIKEYQAQRKKLESRRLSYDAATGKLEKLKHAKKVQEKDREEAEEEYESCKSRYEETLEDVRARMFAIQENEVVQLRELTSFLDLEISFVQSYLHELQKVRDDWIDEETMKKLGAPKARPPPRPSPASRAGSIRSTKSLKKTNNNDSAESSDEAATNSLRKSLSRRKSEAGSKPPSRPQSRASRKRSDSVATAVSEKEKDKEKEKKEKEKEKEEKSAKPSHRLSVAGWASSAMSSVTGRGKKDKDKDKFAALHDEDDTDPSDTDEFGLPKSSITAKRRTSAPGLPSTSPKLPIRMLKSTSARSEKEKDNKENTDRTQARKRVIALHDFAAASTDEISFKVGDQIEVVSEVLDGWWMGELGGKRGLFPTTYTEVINSSSSSLQQKPPIPHRPSSSLSRSLGPSNGSRSRTGSSLSSLEDGPHSFVDRNVHSGAVEQAYEESVLSSHLSDTDDESGSLMRVQRIDDSFSPRYTTALPAPPIAPARASPSPSPAKKAPPPPPPRRSTLTGSPASTPPALPSRPATLRSKSSHSGSSLSILATAGAEELTYSPFDSPRDEVMKVGCSEFKQNPFKPKGYCSNCFQTHSHP